VHKATPMPRFSPLGSAAFPRQPGFNLTDSSFCAKLPRLGTCTEYAFMSNIIVFPVATLLCWPSAPPDSRRQTEKFIHE